MNLEPWIDKYGLITTSYKDGGDTSFYSFHYLMISSNLENYRSVFKALGTHDMFSRNIRHPDPSMWYSEERRFSRDQSTPKVVFFAMNGLYRDLRKFFWKHARHLWLFTWNTRPNWAYPPDHPKHEAHHKWKWKMPDLTGPEFFGFYIRGFRWRWAKRFLFISDLETLFSVLNHRLREKIGKNDGDIANCYAAIRLSLRVYPTFLSALNWKLLKPIFLISMKKYWVHERPHFYELYEEWYNVTENMVN